MTKDVHRFRCPCCNKPLEFDAKSKKVREEQVEKDSGGPEMDQLLQIQKKESTRVGDAFEQAEHDASTHADKFDDMFDSALNEAKQDKDKKPRNPFDMD